MGNQRGFSNTATVLIALLLALLVAPLFMTWVVVDVHTTGEDSVDLTLPVPLAAARIALAFAPQEAVRQPVPAEVARHRDAVLAALAELERCPDAALLTVDAPDARVRITKQGDRLLLDVDADDAVVRGRLPVIAVRRALERWDWHTADPRMALDVVAACGRGELLSVDADDARVSIRIW